MVPTAVDRLSAGSLQLRRTTGCLATRCQRGGSVKRRFANLTVDGEPLQEYVARMSMRPELEAARRQLRRMNGEPDEVAFVASNLAVEVARDGGPNNAGDGDA